MGGRLIEMLLDGGVPGRMRLPEVPKLREPEATWVVPVPPVLRSAEGTVTE
jgi:hypothetical protein